MLEQTARVNSVDRLGDTVSRILVRWHWAFFLLSLVVMAAGAAGLRQLESSTDTRAFFGAANPEYARLLEIEDIYVTSARSLVVVSAPEGQSFAPRTLEVVREATEAAWQLPYVLRIDSLANFNYSRAEGDEIIVEPLMPESGEITPEMARVVRDRAFETGDLVNRLVSEDGRSFGIAISFVPPDRDEETYRQIQNEIDSFAADLEARLPDADIFLTGSIMASLAFSEAGQRDLSETLPLAGAATFALLVLGLGSFAGVTGSLLVLAGGAVVTLGLGGLLGIELTPGNSSSPLAVMVLMAATCMHLVLAWRHAMADGLSRHEAVRQAWERNFAPVTVTNVTTAFGFFCLNVSESPPLQDLGTMVAFGVISGWLLALMAMPTVLICLPARRRRPQSVLPRAIVWCADRALARPRLVAGVFALAIAASAFGISRIEFNDDFIDYFDESYAFRQDADRIEERLTGLRVLQYSFANPAEGGVFDPGFLGRLDQFEAWLRDQPEVRQVSSIVETLKRLNRNMNADDPAYERLADSSAAHAQLMMLYELNLPVGQDLNSQISIDRTETLMAVALDVDSAVELRDFADRSEAWLAENTPEIATQASGAPIVFAQISQRNGMSMLLGTVVVLLVVSASMIVALGDFRFGALSLVPNLAPAILAFGCWGLLFQHVNLGSTVVTVMSFGIVVDDTVHLMMRYKRRRNEGLPPREAVRATLSTVGTAITFTTLMICAGFSIIAMSSFAINEHLGALTALVVAAAYIADLLLLPVLLVQAERKTS